MEIFFLYLLLVSMVEVSECQGEVEEYINMDSMNYRMGVAMGCCGN